MTDENKNLTTLIWFIYFPIGSLFFLWILVFLLTQGTACLVCLQHLT